jgi:hypothetical protein
VSRNQVFTALAVTAVLGVLGASAVAKDDDSDRRGERCGAVQPCSLDGVNPVYHPEIFGNAAAARSFGFEQAKDGTWHVIPGCHR